MLKYYNFIAISGAIILFIGLILQFVRFELAPYIYLLGSSIFAYVQMMSRYEGKNIIIRRLRRQQILGATILVFTGVMMILFKHNEWIVGLTIATLLELYTAFRIPQEEAKEK